MQTDGHRLVKENFSEKWTYSHENVHDATSSASDLCRRSPQWKWRKSIKSLNTIIEIFP